MNRIGLKEIEDIALGASLLGSGGGGDPYIGKLLAMEAIKKHGEVTLLDPDTIPDDALIVPMAMMGAPTVLAEKAANGGECQALFDMIVRRFGKKPYAFMPMEAGGFNSMFPVVCSAMLGLPLVDVDGMGRAFPELQMVTFTIGGVHASPMCLTDEKGNSVQFDTISNKWSEDIARGVTMTCGGSVAVSLYPMDGKTVKAFGVKGIVTKSAEIGKALASIKESKTPEEDFFRFTGAYRLFKGKIVDVLRETRGAFNFGTVVLEGIGDKKGKQANVEFQNENLSVKIDGTYVATVPDLIALVDSETFRPVTTEALKYGKRVLVVALPCFPLWRTEKGISLVGPRYFGLDTDYIPLEERVKEAL